MSAACTSILPASTFDRSRMSLISASRSLPAVWIVCANSICLSSRLPVGVVREHLGQDQQRVERRAQLVRHVRQELALVLGRQRELLGLLLEVAARRLDLAVLDLDVAVLAARAGRLLLQLLVGLLELLLLGLEQLLGGLERLGLLLELRVRALSSSCCDCSSSDCDCSSCVSDCDCSSSCSVRMVAMIVFSTTPMVSVSCSRNCRLIS